jgi:hypothetical protein
VFLLQERMNQLWIAAKRDLEEVKAHLRAKEREREDLSEGEGVEIKVGKEHTQVDECTRWALEWAIRGHALAALNKGCRGPEPAASVPVQTVPLSSGFCGAAVALLLLNCSQRAR